jgi:hypothetical protein
MKRLAQDVRLIATGKIHWSQCRWRHGLLPVSEWERREFADAEKRKADKEIPFFSLLDARAEQMEWRKYRKLARHIPSASDVT